MHDVFRIVMITAIVLAIGLMLYHAPSTITGWLSKPIESELQLLRNS